MKALTQFNEFNWKGFSKDKVFVVTGVSEWRDYDTKQHMGTKVEVVISVDNTQYQQRDGKQISNLYEKLTFKVGKDIQVPIGAEVIPVNPVCSIYGEFRNQLSVRCDDVQASQNGTGGKD